MTAPAKMLLIYVDENDTWGQTPLYEALVRRLRQLEVAGATAIPGMMGFGSHLNVHRKRLFGISDDRPVVISAVDNEETIRRIVPEIRKMLQEGLIAIVDCEVVPLDGGQA